MSDLYLEPYTAEELREKRIELGYGQKELARLAGIHGNTVSSIECGRNDAVCTRMLLTIILDDLDPKEKE